MLFNSIEFLIFLPIVLIIYFSISHKYRWILLLIASYYFYMSWKAEYIILIIISTVIDYISGIKIYNAINKKIKKYFLFLSLFTNIGILFAFKYFNFFSDAFRDLLNLFTINFNPITLKILLPVGISFYTFQTLSYTIDIYRGKIKPQRHLGIFAVYVSFFPQLVAGPIERAKNLLPQFFEKHKFEYKRVVNGLKLMLWGFFKKVVIADRLAIIVNLVYNNPQDFHGFSLIIATIFFAYQIYCDFSGYSDIAIGTAQIMGFKLMDNFKRPYFSKSFSEFWKRWHISLSSWFKDYLYIPLGGNRVSVPRYYLNLLIVFLVSGLWHGANWTFILWGGLHGFYLIFEIIFKPIRNKIYNLIKLNKFPKLKSILEMLIVFIFVNFSWIFFRSNNLKDAFYIIKNLFVNLNLSSLNIGLGISGFLLIFLLILFMEIIHIIQEIQNTQKFIFIKNKIIRWCLYLFVLFCILLLGIFTKTQFIYFQF